MENSERFATTKHLGAGGECSRVGGLNSTLSSGETLVSDGRRTRAKLYEQRIMSVNSSKGLKANQGCLCFFL